MLDNVMMFVVYRKDPFVVYSIHRTFAGASDVKQQKVSDGEDPLNVEVYGLYVKN